MRQNNKIRMPEEFTDMDSKETMLTGGWRPAGCTKKQFNEAKTLQFGREWESSRRKATASLNNSSDITDSIATKAAVTVGIITIIGTVAFVAVETTK